MEWCTQMYSNLQRRWKTLNTENSNMPVQSWHSLHRNRAMSDSQFNNVCHQTHITLKISNCQICGSQRMPVTTATECVNWLKAPAMQSSFKVITLTVKGWAIKHMFPDHCESTGKVNMSQKRLCNAKLIISAIDMFLLFFSFDVE